MNNTKTPKVNFSKLMSMSILKAKKCHWEWVNCKLTTPKWKRKRNHLVTKSIDSRLTLNKWWRIKSIYKLKLMLSTSTWPTWTIKTTAYKRNSKHSLNQMKQSDKVLIERSKLILLDTRLMMSLEDQNKKLKRESWNKNLEELMLNKSEFIMKWIELPMKELPSIMLLFHILLTTVLLQEVPITILPPDMNMFLELLTELKIIKQEPSQANKID